ncbi:MAG: hypothetical protein QME79_06155 [Bacillota bacterium]|nr:hypothetical protein [Bacillota bacterium]
MRRARTIGRRLIPAAFGVILLALALSGQACPGAGTRPQPTRLTRPAPRRVAVRPAPVQPAPAVRPGNLESAVQRTKTAVDRRDWKAADREAAALGDAWRPIRSRRTWPAADLTAFEGAYARLRTAIKTREEAAADRALAQLTRLAQRHAGAAPAPVRTRAPRPMAPGPPRR